LRRHFCQNAGTDLVGLDLRLGNDARLEGIGQHNVLPRHGLFQNLEQPVSVHAGLKDYPTPGPSSHQRNKLLRAEVIDASSFQNHSLCVEHTEDTVAFVIVDADEARLLFQDRLSSHHTIYTPRFYAAPQTIPPADQASISLSCRLIPSARRPARDALNCALS
jgi:hypothetical protein